MLLHEEYGLTLDTEYNLLSLSSNILTYEEDSLTFVAEYNLLSSQQML